MFRVKRAHNQIIGSINNELAKILSNSQHINRLKMKLKHDSAGFFKIVLLGKSHGIDICSIGNDYNIWKAFREAKYRFLVQVKKTERTQSITARRSSTLKQD